MDNTCDTLWKGSDYVLDLGRPFDCFGKKLDLCAGQFCMGPYVEDVMIRKGSKLKQDQFDILKNIQHPALIPLIAFYHESSNMGRFVISKVDASFSSWFSNGGKDVLFDSNGRMTEFFRTLIIDICEIVKILHQRKLVVAGDIDTRDLYVKMLPDGEPKVLLLISKVKSSDNPLLEGRPDWVAVRECVQWCFSAAKFEMDWLSKLFVRFIGTESFSIAKIKAYPDTWEWQRKGEYLMALKSAEQNSVRDALKITNISWPQDLPGELEEIIHRSAQNQFHYSKNVPFDFLQALWNTYKHFKNLGMEEVFGNREVFIQHIDKWSPLFWIALFEKLGWPASQPVL